MNPSNDPSLTAWALDQMSAEERAGYEATLTKEPNLKATADELKDFCQFISTHVKDQKSALTLEQRQKLMGPSRLPSESSGQAVASGTSTPIAKTWWRTPAFILPLSAAAAVMVLAAQFWNPKKTAPDLVAASSATDSFTELAALKKEAPVPTTLPTAITQPAAESKIQQLASIDSWKPLADTRADSESPAIPGQKIDAQSRTEPVAKNEVALDISSSEMLLAVRAAGNDPTPSLRTEMNQTDDTLTTPAPAKRLEALNYTGGTDVNGGVVVLGSSTSQVSGSASGVGGITKTGDGTVTLGGVQTYTGNTTTLGSGAVAIPQIAELETSKRQVLRQIAPPSSTPTATAASPTQNRIWAYQPGAVRSYNEANDPNSPVVDLVLSPQSPNFKKVDLTPEKAAITAQKDPQVAQDTSKTNKADSNKSKFFQSLFRKSKEPSPVPPKEASRETYAPITENSLTETAQQPLSTFSIDVDTAAYANVRRFLNSGSRPPADAVRLEELINYFPYDYEFPQRGEAPFTVAAAIAEAPWHPTHRLARIAIKARDVGMVRMPSNFVFLVDVSSSMDEPNKLPLVQQSLSLLTDQLTVGDRVAIVVYAGNSGLALSSISGDQKDAIREAIRRMKSGGSTHGSAGIRQAYEEAQKNFIKEGVNRVILCTDGDFNVGTTSPEELEKLITEKAKGGVFLSVLGYGSGNTQDRTMETLADKGNGNYAYIDSLSEARKVLVDQMRGTLITVAKDVKIQVEFNPSLVQSYRLIGYENRLLAKEDFNNDAKDAGEIGAGHTVTALYEIIPVGVTAPDGRPIVDPLRYQNVPAAAPSDAAKSGEMMTVKLRYKKPDGDKSELLDFPVRDENKTLKDSDPEFRFATAVASFGLLLRNSTYRGDLSWEQVRQLALGAKGPDANGYRGEFIQLIDKARGILGEGTP